MPKRKSYPESGKPFHIAAKHMELARDTSIHWHDCCEMELVLSGSGTHIINGHSYPLQPGDLYLLMPADCHSIAVDKPLQLLGIMFDENMFSEDTYQQILANEMTGTDLITNLSDTPLEQAEHYFRTVLEEWSVYNQLPLSSSYISHLLNAIAILLLRKIDRTANSTVDKQPMAEAITYLHRHYTEPITLSALAQHLHLAPSYLSASFTAYAGCSFKEYLIDLRLRHACRLLVNTSLSATDVCFNCGFSSYSHFMRTFRAHYNTSPMLFRRQHQNNSSEKG